MRNYHNLTLAFLTSLALIGCGGGGGGGGGSAPAQQPAEEAVETEEEVIETEVVESTANQPGTERTMQDLSVPHGFDYDPIENMTVSIDVSGFSSERAYVSIYSQYDATDSGDFAPSNNHKVAAQALSAGLGEIEITYARGTQSLLAEVWFYDGSDPIQQEFTVTDPNVVY